MMSIATASLSRLSEIHLRRMPHSFAFFANEWAAASEGEGCVVLLAKRRDYVNLDLQRPLLEFHPYQSSLPVKIRTKAATRPLLRFIH